jgi:putative ABC transport system permease protein
MNWLKRLANAIWPDRVDREIRREVAFHIAERTDQLRAAGLPDEEAARQARIVFGNPVVQAERVRDVDVAATADALIRDTRYALRVLARTPGFTLAVVLTLSLAIGANTAVFSALDTVLFKPLPFPDGDRLVRVAQVQDGVSETFIAPPRLLDWARLNATFDTLGGYYLDDVSDTSGDLPERVARAFVTPGFLEAWGVAPAIGRTFSPDEYRFGGPNAIVISERYWRQRLNADHGVLERTVRLGTAAVPIVGVMPASFRFAGRHVDLWSPARIDAPFAQSRQTAWYTGIGRLRQGVTAASAREDLRALQKQLGELYPETDRAVDVTVTPLQEAVTGGLAPSLWLLFGAVSLLLVIACTNIAALLLSRGAARQHEMAVRLSLGGSRAAVIRQLLTETALLALAGGVGGVLVALVASRALRGLAGDLPRLDEMAIDTRVLLYTLASTVVVVLLCGIVPALRTATAVAGVRGVDPRTQVGTRHTLQWLLVGAQVALSIVLLAGAGLLARSFHELSRVDSGFDTARVLTFRVSGAWSETTEYARLVQRIENMIDALGTLPGVEAVATTGWSLPGVPEQWETTFELEEAQDRTARPMVAEGRAVSPEYFEVMRIPLLAGEACRRSPATSGARGELMVNREFARRYLADRPSVAGLSLRDTNGQAPAARIAGVVGDARERGLDREAGPTVYLCQSAPNPTPYVLVRTRGEATAIAQAVRLEMKELEPLRSVYEIAPLEDRIGEAFSEARLRTALLALFAGAALSLSMVGLYGTLSYLVSLRRREVGLRLALGAGRTRIVSHFLARGLRVVAAASLCGVALAVAFAQLLSGMLFGVSPFDPTTLVAVVALVMTVAVVAVLIPATRAALTTPMQVLREQ